MPSCIQSSYQHGMKFADLHDAPWGIKAWYSWRLPNVLISLLCDVSLWCFLFFLCVKSWFHVLVITQAFMIICIQSVFVLVSALLNVAGERNNRLKCFWVKAQKTVFCKCWCVVCTISCSFILVSGLMVLTALAGDNLVDLKNKKRHDTAFSFWCLLTVRYILCTVTFLHKLRFCKQLWLYCA